jgi:DNA processing protein
MTIIVEAAEPSGSLITPQHATELHRNVGAVPGQVGMRVAGGPHALIRDAAALIRGAQDVLDEMLWIGPFGIRNRDAGDDGVPSAPTI